MFIEILLLVDNRFEMDKDSCYLFVIFYKDMFFFYKRMGILFVFFDGVLLLINE